MAGKIKVLIDKIIQARADGNSLLVYTTRTKLLMKGINPDSYDESSPDDPTVMKELHALAESLGIDVR